MMESDVDPNKLSIGEQVQKGLGKSWANPAYWSRQFVTAPSTLRTTRRIIQGLGARQGRAQPLLSQQPGRVHLGRPAVEFDVKEGPIREAAAKLNLSSFILHTNRPLDAIPLPPNSFDAALCFDMLDAAPEQAVQGTLALMYGGLRPSGRLLFLERSSVGLPGFCREYGFNVQFEEEGGFDVGIATKRVVGDGKKAKAKVAKKLDKEKKSVIVDPTKGGFGAGAGSINKAKVSEKEKAARKAAKEAQKLEKAALAEERRRPRQRQSRRPQRQRRRPQRPRRRRRRPPQQGRRRRRRQRRRRRRRRRRSVLPRRPRRPRRRRRPRRHRRPKPQPRRPRRRRRRRRRRRPPWPRSSRSSKRRWLWRTRSVH